MDAYVYHAALLCRDCAQAELGRLPWPLRESGDSDKSPQGPYPDGGGEADIPQHCDHCGVFLENPLTPGGVEYVRAAVDDCKRSGRECPQSVQEWREFYRNQLEAAEAAARAAIANPAT